MRYQTVILAIIATAAQAASSRLNSRRVGTIYPMKVNGTFAGGDIFQIEGGEWNVTAEGGFGQNYGKAAAQKVASGLAYVASLYATAEYEPYTISASAKGAHGGNLTVIFTKTNEYYSYDDYDSTQWTAIFNAAVNAIVGERYPKSQTLTCLVDISNNGGPGYLTNEGTLTWTFKA